MTTRTLRSIHRGDSLHWVGDGFYVTQLLPGGPELRRQADPFLLMDYNPPRDVAPTDTPGGVGPHPHRGFETVTLAFAGSVAHHDSTGAGGVIHPGDAQWMTAASGLLHQEYHEVEWAKKGGKFHMLQLWVNLPAKHKMDPPKYQTLTADSMGRVALPTGGAATLYAGELNGVRGPARTFTPVNLWDVHLTSNETATLGVVDGHTQMVLVLDGSVTVGPDVVREQELGVFHRDGDALQLTAPPEGARVIVLGGEPINENVIFHGPFAMNTQEEILQAVTDYETGKFGQLG